ncbi:MAG: hypothetical protein KUG81_02180, partial [Gammaproteobacteria bacterium]|nr:hypothetical protein [Gammaproteobacteria bacterium]
TTAFAAITENSYFLLNSPTEGYYVWFDKGVSPVDPGLMPAADLFIPVGSAHGRIGVVVDISGDTTADDVATSIRAAVGALSDFTTAGATNEVAITNVKLAIADTIADGTTATGFTFNAGTTTPVVPGVSPSFGWASSPPGTTTETFMYINTASPGTVAAGSTWVTLSNTTDTNVTWSSAVFGGHDAGSNFAVATGIFTVPTTGIWQLSAAVNFEGNNTGNGGGGIPGRRAVRQMRVFRTNNTPASLAEGERQANPRNLDPAQIYAASAAISLTAADEIVVQVRHDASSALDIDFEDETGVAAPVTYFSCHRVA